MGFHSYVMFYPDMDFGIFFSSNYGNHTYERQLISQFVADIMLGEEPWNTAEEACQLIEDLTRLPNVTSIQPCPETRDVDVLLQWLHETDDPETPDFTYIQNSCIRQFKNRVVLYGRPETFRDLEDYEGVYGHFGFGNLTIFLNETTGLLDLQYGGLGRFDLYSTSEEDVFMGQGKDACIIRFAWPVIFEESVPGSGLIDLATLPLMERSSQPSPWVRGLEMSDAPPPRIEDCSWVGDQLRHCGKCIQ